MERLSLPRIDCFRLSNSPQFEATILKAFYDFFLCEFRLSDISAAVGMESRDVKTIQV